MNGMDHSRVNVIDGREHPELIPDSVAYRMYFLTVGEFPNPTDARKKRQSAFLSKARLSDKDSSTVVRVLEDFRVKFASMATAYNAQVEAAVKAGTGLPDGNVFMAQRDRLVQDTRDRLKLALSVNGMANLDAHIQTEKANMRLNVQQVTQ
jgi:hypothetical protein